MIGYEKMTFVVNQVSPELKLVMKSAASNLNEHVVTTALGIKRAEKALGYAQQTIGSDALTDARPNNWSDALRGKVAGLNIAGLGGPSIPRRSASAASLPSLPTATPRS